MRTKAKLFHDPETVFKFVEELPPGPDRAGTIKAVLPKLDVNPQMWARIRGPYGSGNSAKASAIHSRSRFDGYEFFARQDPDDHETWYLYARCVKNGARRK